MCKASEDIPTAVAVKANFTHFWLGRKYKSMGHFLKGFLFKKKEKKRKER